MPTPSKSSSTSCYSIRKLVAFVERSRLTLARIAAYQATWCKPPNSTNTSSVTHLTRPVSHFSASRLYYLAPTACFDGRPLKAALWTCFSRMWHALKLHHAKRQTNIWQRTELCACKSTSRGTLVTRYSISQMRRRSQMGLKVWPC